MKFQYFTYFLNPLEQKALFVDNRDKNEVLRELLGKKIEYEVRGVKLAFVLVSSKNNYFIARLGKKASIKRNSPPDKKFEETHEENWPYCTVVINTNTDNGTGQKIAFEFKSNIFPSTFEQLKHFADEVNTHIFSSGYAIAINPITEEKEFWKIVEENEDKIEKLTFSFNSPNLFGIKNSLNEDLKDLQKEYSSTKVSLELENPDGKLNIPKNDLTKQSIEYVTQGGGQYSLKIKGKYRKVISSKDNIKTKTFDDLDIHINGSNQETLFSILDTIFK
ncbi:MAG: hypothetical protein KBD52_01055 [Candidatus Pacebacteria bacterium]|nr:hypothetical protein [Candidatus Paceibacterota bacterium]